MTPRLFLIVTHPSEKEDRFAQGDEWKDIWGFSEECSFAYRVPEKGHKCCKEVGQIPQPQGDEDRIMVWFKTRQISNIPQSINDVVQHMALSEKDVAIAYHGFDYTRIPHSLTNRRPYGLLEEDKSEFEPIIREDKAGASHLEADADFENVVKCLFGRPANESLNILKHAITHLFLPLDLDLQKMEELDDGELEEYVATMRQARTDDYDYRRMLVELWFLAARVEKAKFGRREITSSLLLSSNTLVDSKSVWDLIRGQGLEQEAEQLLDICGLEEKGNWPQPQLRSPIRDFMATADTSGLLGSNNGICVGEETFHHWFVKLIKCLDSLQLGLENVLRS